MIFACHLLEQAALVVFSYDTIAGQCRIGLFKLMNMKRLCKRACNTPKACLLMACKHACIGALQLPEQRAAYAEIKIVLECLEICGWLALLAQYHLLCGWLALLAQHHLLCV